MLHIKKKNKPHRITVNSQSLCQTHSKISFVLMPKLKSHFYIQSIKELEVKENRLTVIILSIIITGSDGKIITFTFSSVYANISYMNKERSVVRNSSIPNNSSSILQKKNFYISPEEEAAINTILINVNTAGIWFGIFILQHPIPDELACQVSTVPLTWKASGSPPFHLYLRKLGSLKKQPPF